MASAVLMLSLVAGAQSKNFRLAKWLEIHGSILNELNRSYVDTLPLDRIERASVDAMLSSLDPYTTYIPVEENKDFQLMISNTYGGMGAIIYKPDVQGNVIINEPYLGSPSQKAGLVCGDELLYIDTLCTRGITSSEASAKLRGEPGTRVHLKVKKLRSGDTLDVDIVREKIHLPDVVYSGMIDSQTGYIVQTGFSEGVYNDFRAAVIALKKQGMKRLFIDLRGNGGGLMSEAVDIVSLFVPKGSLIVTAKGRASGSEYKSYTTKSPVDLNLPLYVLINSSSASASEIVAGALQDLDRATIMGARSFGKGLVQSIRPLPYGGQLKLTTAKYYTPSGRCVQAIDYATRREDGSVEHIPDSLTHEFKTASGRVVKDGGGIMPDVLLKQKEYSRLTFSLVRYGIIEEFVLDYVRRHENIPAAEDFHLGDEEFERFVEFASKKEFDYRSSAKTYFDWLKTELNKDGISQTLTPHLEAMEAALKMEKVDFIRLKKDEIIPFIEEEIVVRYYYQQAGVKIRIRYDDELREAMNQA